MRHFTHHRFIVSLFCYLLCLATPLTGAAQTQEPDETAARAAVGKFFAAYQRRDLPGVLALWSERAPELAAVKQTLQKNFAANGQFELKSLDIRKVTIEAGKAHVEVEVELNAIDAETGRPVNPVLMRGTRVLRLVKEEAMWKIWQDEPIEAALAATLIAAKTDDERKALLASRAQLVTPELIRELNKRARVMLVPRTSGELLPVFSLALSLAERLSDRAGLIESWHNIGNVHRLRGDVPQALEAFGKSLSLAEEAHNLEAVNAALNATAAVYFMKGQHEQALDYLRRSIEVARQRGDTTYVLRTLSNIGLVHKSQGKLTEAIVDYRASLDVAEQTGDKASAAVVVNDLGNTYMLLSDYPQARASYEQGLRLAREINDKRSISAAFNNLGILAQTLGDYDQALDNFQQSLALAEAAGDKQAIGTAHNNIGRLNYTRGDYARALEAYQRSLQLREEIKHRAGIASTLNNIGLIHKSQGNHALALDYLQRALTLKQELNDRPSIASSLNALGSLYHAQRDYARALDYLQQSLKVHESLGDRSGLARALSHIGLIYYDRGDYTTALDQWQRSLAIRESLGEKASITATWGNVANAYLKLGRFAESLEYADRAVISAQAVGQPEIYMNARTTAGRAYDAMRKPEQARQALLNAVAAAEQLRMRVAGGEEEQERSFERLVEPYYVLVGLLIRQGETAEALAYAERAKGRVLLDVLSGGRQNVTKSMTADEVKQERTLVASMVALNTQLARLRQKPGPDAALVSQLDAQLQQARRAYESFQINLFAAHPQLRVQRGQSPPLTGVELTALVPNDTTALIEYVVTDNQVYLFVITRSAGVPKLQAYTLNVSGAELAELVHTFRRRVAERDLTVKQPARRLYDLLVKPAERQLQGVRKLCIVPDGVLWELPFQALHAGGYLLEQYAVFYAPSLSVLREMSRRRDARASVPRGGRPAGGASLFALGNPVLSGASITRVGATRDDPLAQLPSGEREVNTLGQLYGRGRSRILIGSQAREAAVKAEAGAYRVLHFATHALLDDRNPMYSRILLASEPDGSGEDGLLEAWEVMKLDLSADLTVLSACQTARGRVAPGEGMIGLSWALFVAGSPAAVVTQWEVDSERSATLMVEFHRNLLRSRAGGQRLPTKSEALRQAALKLLHSPYSHPAYWAGFILIGDEQ